MRSEVTMGLFSKRNKIQAMEGERRSMDIESGMLARLSSSVIPGIINEYLTYEGQVEETYKKYRGEADWGCASVRTIIDTRTAFIAGEGLAISADKNVKTREWISKFIKKNKLDGSRFYEAVMGTEMSGRALFIINCEAGEFPVVVRIPYAKKEYELSIKNKYAWVPDSVKIRDVTVPVDKFVYVRTGGDDLHWDTPTTRTGIVLTDCENYDRALKDIRRTNHTVSRITPTFKTETDMETAVLSEHLKNKGWKIGQAFVGKAALEYKTAGTGALENLKTELSSSAKNISAVTGVPVHWFGWTDLMSNRATAEDLYQMVSNATSRERTLIAESIYELIVKAQAMYIDNGGTEITEVDDDFVVRIPSIDYGHFEQLVRALSVAYTDEAISMDDYRSFIPGIDPFVTKKAVDKEKKERMKLMPTLVKGKEENGEEEEDDENIDPSEQR